MRLETADTPTTPRAETPNAGNAATRQSREGEDAANGAHQPDAEELEDEPADLYTDVADEADDTAGEDDDDRVARTPSRRWWAAASGVWVRVISQSLWGRAGRVVVAVSKIGEIKVLKNANSSGEKVTSAAAPVDEELRCWWRAAAHAVATGLTAAVGVAGAVGAVDW
jgi:hypothetical protein